MPQPAHGAGDTFNVHFVWKLPDGDFLRAIYEARVLALDESLDRYLLRLERMVGGRQEDAGGEMRLRSQFSRDYWQMAGEIQGKRVYLAYEVEDGRPLRMRLETLTGEHTFFSRLEGRDLPE